jgi:PAS domain S-box-containing protein
MATRANAADLVFAGCLCLVALALLMLGWQIIHTLAWFSPPTPVTQAGSRSPQALLFIGVAVCGIILALLWALFYQRRAWQRAEMRLERMADRLPGGFYVLRLSDDGICTYEFLTVNAASLLGVSRDQVLQDSSVARRLVLEEDRARVDAALLRSHEAMSPVEIDFRILRPDGEIRWIRTLAVPARTSNRDVVWNGHLFDVTKIRSTEQALRQATQRMEEAQSVANFGDWTCELATGALSWSPQMYQLLGRDPTLGPPNLAEVVDMLLEGHGPTAAAFEMAQTTGKPQSFETSALLPSGDVIVLDVIVLPVADATGNVVGMRGTIQDITVRKTLERGLSLAKDAADSANHAKSEFLATMSHEIRTPLNGMLGILELISLTPVNPEIRTALRDVRDSGESLQRIIDDILDFSKVEAGKLEIRAEASRLVDVVGNVHRIYASSASSVGLDFSLHLDPDISPILLLDALRVRQILGNFVSNAIKFTPRGSIELRVLLAGRDGDLEHLRFEVQDTGIGISASEQRTLFERFEQAQSNASRFGGTGLGLSITRRLAELMGGRVSMTSVLGAGTTMTLDITAPVVAPVLSLRHGSNVDHPQTDEPDWPSLQPQAGGSGALILVVDDHPTNRMVMRSQILALGYAAEDVGSAGDALARWNTGKFSLVLTDLNMPLMSGYDLSRRIREAEAGLDGRRTPIIACSANVIGGVVEQCLDAGMDDYIAKPMKLMELSQKLTRWLPVPIAPQAVASPAQHPSTEGLTYTGVTRTGGETGGLGGQIEPRLSQRALAHFRQVNDVDVMHFLDAVEQGDMEAVTHRAHRIKGACGFIGASKLASVCGMIEQAGREKDGAGVAWLVNAFHTELEQLNATLDS